MLNSYAAIEGRSSDTFNQIAHLCICCADPTKPHLSVSPPIVHKEKMCSQSSPIGHAQNDGESAAVAAKVAKGSRFRNTQDLYLTPAFHSWFCSFWLLSVLVKKERTLLPPSPEGVCCFVRCTGLKEESTHVMFAPPFHPVRAERRAAVTFVTSWGAEH